MMEQNLDEPKTHFLFAIAKNRFLIIHFHLTQQRKGYGTRILQMIKEFCLENGLETIHLLEVRPECAHKFAKKHKFSETYSGEFKNYSINVKELTFNEKTTE